VRLQRSTNSSFSTLNFLKYMLLPNDLPISGLIEFTPRRFVDARGYFVETYNARAFAAVGIEQVFVQDNQSVSARGVLRGLHFQRPPHAQAKLVRVLAGRVLDVTVDLRTNSPTFGQHHAVVLDAAIGNAIYIPAGFAHGFLSLENDTMLQYKCTDYYYPETEGSLRWNDPALGIDWGITAEPLVSDKDAVAPLLADLVSPF
jgi:dTDP-4-dehydrorhamnose 3,5-epimerase